MAKTPDDTVHSAPLVEFLNTLPSPLTTTLVALAPFIAKVRHAAQITTWKAPWEECWLSLAAWWAVCLVPELGLRYLLPLVVFVVFFRLRANPKTSQAAPPVTEDILQRAIADLTTIQTLLPSLPVFTRPYTLPPPTLLFRTIAWLYVPYLALTYLIRIRILIALTGTLFLTWNARWTSVMRNGLWRSSHIRWAVYRAWSRISGEPLPPFTLSPQSQSDAKLASVSSKPSSASAQTLPSTSVRFLFTIYENQRWWMGLDWTAALLPGERPSWCSASQQPAAPPSAFALPAATTVYTPAADGKHRVKRTARWRWEEHEWRVVVRRETGTSRVERPVPSAEKESAAAASASRILKAAGKMRAPSESSEKRVENGKEGHNGEGDEVGESGEVHAHAHPEPEEDEEPLTDPDGWVYADNKWEGGSSKGGMGKYTRYRRWTRVAVLTETVEIVGPGELGIQRDEPVLPAVDVHHPEPSPPPALPAPPAVSIQNAQAESVNDTMAHETQSPTRLSISLEEEGSRLRQRLKAAVMGATGHS
ncbi:integral peroxisomal membrane peroxin-domain-containing protein [Earliella scabrosa]|nr:integral peroxisomal membrane peroxin-domain-containing protein [Earliella scabrosa]